MYTSPSVGVSCYGGTICVGDEVASGTKSFNSRVRSLLVGSGVLTFLSNRSVESDVNRTPGFVADRYGDDSLPINLEDVVPSLTRVSSPNSLLNSTSLSVVDGYVARIVGWKAKSFVEGYGADLLHACLNPWEVTLDKNLSLIHI